MMVLVVVQFHSNRRLNRHSFTLEFPLPTIQAVYCFPGGAHAAPRGRRRETLDCFNEHNCAIT